MSTAHAALVRKAPVRYIRETTGMLMYLSIAKTRVRERVLRSHIIGKQTYHDIKSNPSSPIAATPTCGPAPLKSIVIGPINRN